MYIEAVPNRNSPPAVLLRESYRQDGKVKKRTLANLSKCPPEVVEGLRVLLKGGTAIGPLPEAFDLERSLPHGHVAAALGAIERLGLPRRIDSQPSPQRDRAVALIAARILHPGSKLAAARGLAEETARDTLGEALELGEVSEDDLVRRHGLAAYERQDGHRAAPGQTAFERGNAGAVRPDFGVSGRAGAVRWPSAAIPATASAPSFRSSSACCATPGAVRWRWRCSRAMRPTR